MNPSLRMLLAAAAALSTAPTGSSQQQPSTLAALARRADVVVRASVTYSTLPTPAWRQVGLRTDEVLAGSLGATFVLTEPAGRCCGRSLFTLSAGDERLLFLRRVGPTLRVLGGERGLLPNDAALLAHVRALLRADTDDALRPLLVQQLTDKAPRVADDAAAALAVLPTLALTAAERSAVEGALAASVRRGLTAAAPLADVLARLGDATAVDALVPLFLETPYRDRAALLERALRRCPPQVVADRVALQTGAGARRSDVRAAALLAKLPGSAARSAMAAMLSRPAHPQLKLKLCEGLLQAGLPPETLAPMVPRVVLDLAVSRSDRRPTFKNVLRER